MTDKLSEIVEDLRSKVERADGRDYVNFHIVDIQNLADTIEAEVKLLGWQDISTAPKDGSEILLLEGQRVGCANWVHWGPIDELETEEGWTVCSDGNGWNAPTHWQPLPQPPEPTT